MATFKYRFKESSFLKYYFLTTVVVFLRSLKIVIDFLPHITALSSTVKTEKYLDIHVNSASAYDCQWNKDTTANKVLEDEDLTY